MHNLENTAPTDEGNGQARTIAEQDGDTQSFVQVEMVVPPWAEGNELQAEGTFHSSVNTRRLIDDASQESTLWMNLQMTNFVVSVMSCIQEISLRVSVRSRVLLVSTHPVSSYTMKFEIILTALCF